MNKIDEAIELNQNSANPHYFDKLKKKIANVNFQVKGDYPYNEMIKELGLILKPIIKQIIKCLPDTLERVTFEDCLLLLVFLL